MKAKLSPNVRDISFTESLFWQVEEKQPQNGSKDMEKKQRKSQAKQQSGDLKYGSQGALSLSFKSYGRPRSWIALH